MSNNETSVKTQLPPSVTNNKINLIGLCGFLAGVAFLMSHPLTSSTVSILLLLFCWIFPILILETFFLPHVRQAIRPYHSRQLNLKNTFIRWIGLIMTLSVIGLAYWVFPEYHDQFYEPFWKFLTFCLPWFLALSFPYFLCLGDCIPPCDDPYYQIGLAAFGRKPRLTRSALSQYALGWLIKAFFLPLMIAYFGASIQKIEEFNSVGLFNNFYTALLQLFHPSSIDTVTHSLSTSFAYVFNFSWDLIFLIDLGIVCVGYLCTLRLFDAQIRSAEPTLLGWLVALCCYAPFNSMLSASYMGYDRNGYSWGVWLFPHDIIYVIWGTAILFLCLIYVYASITFGLRFSNLTHRGIITNGPYRYFKHPAYLSKNLSWWLVAIPFISADANYFNIIRNICMLLLLNFIYYLRAKTEERHLSHDPVYQEYVQSIQTNGLFAKLKKKLSSLRGTLLRSNPLATK
ncbi:MAG: DUF1295 domain-containing protein [Legionellales bacterium]|nr:DUF1295 domain-containing protein [Legionellales bacterium]